MGTMMLKVHSVDPFSSNILTSDGGDGTDLDSATEKMSFSSESVPILRTTAHEKGRDTTTGDQYKLE